MITRPELWKNFETTAVMNKRLTYPQARRVFNALYREAENLGIFKRRGHPLQGLEADIRLAKALNSLSQA